MRSQALHKSLPPFSPYIPVAALPFLAFLLLTVAFALAFYFSMSAHVALLCLYYLIDFTVYRKEQLASRL